MRLVLVFLLFAPAPLPRRASAPTAPPERVIMHWAGATYGATFLPDGRYRCDGIGWSGHWRLRGKELAIDESCTPGDPKAAWLKTRIRLTGWWSGHIIDDKTGEPDPVKPFRLEVR